MCGFRTSSRRSSPVIGVDDPDVQVLDEQDDVGSGVGSADADVVQSAVVADGDGARPCRCGRGGSGRGCRGRGSRRAWPWASSRRASPGLHGVAVSGAAGGGCTRRRSGRGGPGVRRCGGWTGWARSHFFIVCWNRLDLAAGGRVVWVGSSSGRRVGVAVRSRRCCVRRGHRPGGRCRPCRCRSGSRPGFRARPGFRGRW